MKVDNLHELIREATDNNRYRRGEELLIKNKISDAYFTMEDGIIDIHGTVSSKDEYYKYNAKLGFNSRSERLTTMSCDCMDFYNSRFSSEYLICKHIVALGLFFEECNRGKDTENIQDEREKEYGNNLIGKLELHKTREELVDLEVYICERNGRFEGEMKIGTSQMYVVKSIKKLIEAIEEDDIIEYGKNFTFDGSRHYFSEKDNEILDYFEEYVELQKRSDMFDTLSGKSIVFVNNALKRLILTLGDKFLNIQNEMLSRYGIDSEDIRNQLKTMGVDLPSLDNDFDYEMARKNVGFTEKYKAGISNATYTTYKISNEKNNLDILLKDTEMIIKSEGKVNLDDNELNEFICSYKKLYSDNKINVSIFENVKTYEY